MESFDFRGYKPCCGNTKGLCKINQSLESYKCKHKGKIGAKYFRVIASLACITAK